jgi:hypothetical protein
LYFRFWVRLDPVLDQKSPEQVRNDPNGHIWLSI